MFHFHDFDAHGGRLWPEAIATQRVGGQIESISWNTADGFGAAMNAFIGQNYGAGKTERVKKGYRVSLWNGWHMGTFDHPYVCVCSDTDRECVFP